MSYAKCVYLYCDGEDDCPLQGVCWCEGLGTAPLYRQREMARRDGWIVGQPGGRDYCPDCAKRLELKPGGGDAEK